MQHSEFLVATAQIGVALAGFASLISVLGSTSETLDFTRLLGMVRNSLAASGFALLPFVPHALGMSEPNAWRVSATIFAVVHSASALLTYRMLFRVRMRLRQAPSAFFTFPTTFLVIVLSLIAAVLPAGAFTAGLYLAALAGLLSVAGVLFLSLFSDFIRARIK